MTIQIKKNTHMAFGCLVALLLVLVFTRYAFSVEIPKLVLTAVLIAIAAVGNRNELMAVSLCCIPMHEAVDFYVAVGICAIFWIAKSMHSFRIGFAVILFMVMACYELLHFFLPGFEMQSMVGSLIPFLFVVAIMSSDISDIDYAFVVRTVALIAFAMGIMLLLHLIVSANFNLIVAFANMRRLGHLSEDAILKGGAINPNTLGIINVLSSTGLLQLHARNQSKKTDYLLIVLLIILGAFTASRTFFVCLLTMAVLVIVGERGSVRKKLRMCGLMAMIAITALLLLNIFLPSALEYYIGRFQVEDLTGGREGLMMEYHDFIWNHPWVGLFGVGLSGFGNKVVNIYQASANTPHNSIQEIVVAWGIPGLLMITAMIVNMVIQAKKNNHHMILLNFVPLIIILVKSMAGQLLSSGYSILALAFAYCSLCVEMSMTRKAGTEVNENRVQEANQLD